MHITVLGASGKVGRRVVELAIQRGHSVVAVVHRHNPFQTTPNLLVKQADVYQAHDVREALNGCDVVISALGSWGTPKRNVLTNAMQAVIPAMQTQGIERIVTLTGSGATKPGVPLTRSQHIMLTLLTPFPAGKVFRDGITHMELLAASKLAWTTVRSPIMTTFGRQSYHLTTKPARPWATIHRQAVATALLDIAETTSYIAQTPIIERG